MGNNLRLIQLLQLLNFCTAAVPSVNPESLNQPGAALALNFSGSPIPSSPSPGTTAIRGIFPPVYYVRYTTPQIIFQVVPSIQIPYRPYSVTYAVVLGMNMAVDLCVLNKGDAKIPAGGFAFAPADVGISIKSSAPGTVDITYSMAAAILRGLWELVAYYGSYTIAVDIYIGSVNPGLYRGRAKVYVKVGSNSNTTADTVPPISLPDTAISSG